MKYTNEQYIEYIETNIKDADVKKASIKAVNNNDMGMKFLLCAKMK